MKIATSTILAPKRLAATGGIRALATAMAIAALTATTAEGVHAKIFTSPCESGICGGNTIAEYRALETSLRLPTKQIKDALMKYDGVVIIGTPTAIAMVLAELDDYAEIAQDDNLPFDAELIAITLAEV